MKILLFLWTTAILSAQTFSVGVKGGLPLTDATQSFTAKSDQSRPYIVGPVFEISLPAHFALEADALYQRVGNGQALPGGGPYFILVSGFLSGGFVSDLLQRVRGNAWTFPLLAKYYFKTGAAHWQPYAGLGFAFRTVGYQSVFQQSSIDANGVLNTVALNSNYRGVLGVGAVTAAGVRFRLARRFTLAPEIRYTRWGSADSQMANNEASLLLSVAF